MSVELPVVDLRLGRAGSEQRQKLARRTVEALAQWGFLYLEGLQGYDSQEVHQLCEWFYRLPMEYRMKITKKMFSPSSSYTYRGYFPVQPGNQSHKEAFEMGSFFDGPGEAPNEESKFFFEDNQWPEDPAGRAPFAFQFKEKMQRYYQVLSEAGLELLRLAAEGSGADSDTFTQLFRPNHLSTYRLIHYPDRRNDIPDCARKDDYVLRCDEHQDSGFVTLLDTFEYRGLQLLDTSGVWRDVQHRPGALVVNIGILFSRITKGALKATTHRVVDYGGSRFSAPFFLEPSYGADVNQSLEVTKDTPDGQKNELQRAGDRMSYGRWQLNKLVGYIEYESLKNIEIAEQTN